jgi:hypothetical protein
MKFFAPEKIGPTRSKTPEGYLLLEGVPIARTGIQNYLPGEIATEDGEIVQPGRDGIVKVIRDDAEVFRPETIASFAGKPVTNEHPDEFVSPETWKRISVGVTLNPRRGEGADSHLLLADLLVTDAEAIKAIEGGKVEISCGYDAAYVETAPGQARQERIIGNHVALVDSGRCGTVCSIGDSKPMAKRHWYDGIVKAFKTKDEAALMEELGKAEDEFGEEGGEGGNKEIHIHVNGAAPSTETKPDPTKPTGDEGETIPPAIEARLQVLEKGHAKIMEAIKGLKPATTDEDPDDTDEDKGKGGTTDSAKLLAEFQDAMSRAEILSPGIRLPTFDAKAAPKKTADNICAIRRKALNNVLASDRKRIVEPLLRGRTLDAMTCDAVFDVFMGASEVARTINNAGAAGGGSQGQGAKAPSIAEINKRNREFHSRSA